MYRYNYIIFYILAVIHILIWLFIVCGFFINKNFALFNLLIFIPLIYFLHIFPFHIITELKSYFNKNSSEDFEKIEKFIKFYYLKNYFNFSFQNPLSPQGLLILGYILNFYYFYFKHYTVKS